MATFAKATFSHALYAAVRPTYPPALYETVLAFHHGPRNLALDLGCGTGFATRDVGKHFAKAIGTDPSEGMVRQAREATPDGDITFHQGSAESTPGVGDGVVDLVIAAQAAHWFNYAKLWPEMERLVRKGGTLAFWGYKDPIFVDFPHASKLLLDYSYDKHPDRLGSYWPEGRQYVREKLRVVQPPESAWEDVTRVEYEPGTGGKHTGQGTPFIEKTASVAACKEYVRTFSPYHDWKETHPGQQPRSQGGTGDIADQMFDEMAEKEVHFRDETNLVDIEWGSAIVMARRK